MGFHARCADERASGEDRLRLYVQRAAVAAPITVGATGCGGSEVPPSGSALTLRVKVSEKAACEQRSLDKLVTPES
jgi:hypothetical protein